MLLSSFEIFLQSLQAHSLFDLRWSSDDFKALDLSVYNPDLKMVKVASSEDLQQFIWNYMQAHNAKFAFGGYLESRNIYQRSAYFMSDNLETNRHIHLGLDVWGDAYTPVFAPLPGIIHSFKNNTNYGDYGPTLILKHQLGGFEFYTLYGHLSLASIQHLEPGVAVKEGEQIATLGTAEVNGDYPPHLHFQIIKDIQDYTGDYPGVCSSQDLQFYKHNCPDPNFLLKIR